MLSRIYRTESEIRKRQINTLKIFNDNVSEITEDLEYKVTFKSGGHEFDLIVTLSKDFPNDKPNLRISPIVIHPWVDVNGEITSAPGLLNFTVHSDLGRVVQAIISEFIRTPPPLASEQPSITSPSVPVKETISVGRASPNFTLNYMGRPNLTISNQINSVNLVQSVAFPKLNTLTLEELQELNESEILQEEFIEELPQIKEMNKTVDDLISQVEELAESNLSKQEKLEELKKGVDDRLEEVTKLAFETERLNLTYQTLSANYSPRNIKALLTSAAQEAETNSEKVAQSFLNGEMDVDKFVNIYLQVRTLSQTRKTKEEKLTQQLHYLERAGF